MSSIATSLTVFACTFGGALLGMLLRATLPERHLDAATKDVVKLGTGVIATMTALSLGALLASAKASYDTQNREVTEMSAKIVVLDRFLAAYGPETKASRDLLRGDVVAAIDRIWPANHSRPPKLEPMGGYSQLYDAIQGLTPSSELQRSLQARALNKVVDIGEKHVLLAAQQGDTPLFKPLMVALIFWLTITFISLSLHAPPNFTIIATLLVCALSVSSAILLVRDMSTPFDGFVQVSSAPLRNALKHLGQ
jgi:hypothetical protein